MEKNVTSSLMEDYNTKFYAFWCGEESEEIYVLFF